MTRKSPMFYVDGESGLSFFTTQPGQGDVIRETWYQHPPHNQALGDQAPSDPSIVKQTQPMDVAQAARVLSVTLQNWQNDLIDAEGYHHAADAVIVKIKTEMRAILRKGGSE